MRAPGFEPWWAEDTTVPLTIQPQVGSRKTMKLTASTSQILHVDRVLALSLLYSVTMPAYSMC